MKSKYKLGEQCDHGQLKRSCELCELQDRNWLLKEQVKDLELELATTKEALKNQMQCVGELKSFLSNSNKECEELRSGFASFVKNSGWIAERNRKSEDVLIVLLREIQPIICSYLCPSTKNSDEEWTHCPLCHRIKKEIELENRSVNHENKILPNTERHKMVKGRFF